MRFHFITHPITFAAGNETIGITFRDANEASAGAPSVSVYWERTEKGDWEKPDVTISGNPLQVAGMARILNAVRNFSDKSNETFGMSDPAGLLEAITETHGEQAVLDESTQTFIPTRKVDNADTAWRVMVNEQSILVVKSDAEVAARTEAGRRLMALVDADPTMSASLTVWLSTGRPMQKVESENTIAQVHPLDPYNKRDHETTKAEKAKRKSDAEAKAILEKDKDADKPVAEKAEKKAKAKK